MTNLTPRQEREIAYHTGHSLKIRTHRSPIRDEVITHPNRKWWNHYWAVYSILASIDLRGRSVLVPGCGAGDDAILCAKLGANVHAFDLSPEMLQLAEEAAAAEGVTIEFRRMPAEQLCYADGTFDLIFVRDLLHHCVVDQSVAEIARVSKPDALVVVDELYTHTALQKLRNSAFGAWMYSIVRPHIYHGDAPYITQDEKKINEAELDTIRSILKDVQCRYFNVVVNRFVPDWDPAEIIDRALVGTVGRAAYYLAGRVVMKGTVTKS